MIKDGICLLSWIILAFLQACDASTTLSFMNYMNPDPNNLSKEEKEAAIFINKLYNCKTVSDVADMLGDKVPEYLRSQNLPQKVADIMKNTQIKPPQRHPRILALIRDMKYDLSDPWNVSDMDLAEFMKHFADANNADKEQTKVLSSLSFTAIRSIQSVKKDYQDRKLDKTSTVARRQIIIIKGTSITNSEQNHIKQELSSVVGGSSEFSIQVVSLHEQAKDESATLQQDLDDFKSGDADIYDHTRVNAHRLLRNGPDGDGYLLLQLMCSHLRSVDRMKLKDNQMYGESHCSWINGKVILPSVGDVRDALGINQACTSNKVGTSFAASKGELEQL